MRLIIAVMSLAAVTVSNFGCMTCANCHDYAGPVAGKEDFGGYLGSGCPSCGGPSDSIGACCEEIRFGSVLAGDVMPVAYHDGYVESSGPVYDEMPPEPPRIHHPGARPVAAAHRHAPPPRYRMPPPQRGRVVNHHGHYHPPAMRR